MDGLPGKHLLGARRQLELALQLGHGSAAVPTDGDGKCLVPRIMGEDVAAAVGALEDAQQDVRVLSGQHVPDPERARLLRRVDRDPADAFRIGCDRRK